MRMLDLIIEYKEAKQELQECRTIRCGYDAEYFCERHKDRMREIADEFENEMIEFIVDVLDGHNQAKDV